MKNQSTVLGIMGLLILLALWQIGSLILAQTMPLANMLAPAAALGSLKTLLLGGQLWEHIFASLQRVGVGLGFALLIGVPVGFALGLSRKTEQTASPAFQFLRMISPLSWMPVVVMLFGIGNAPIYFLLAFAAVWAIILNTAAGVKNINPQWLELGRSLSATQSEMLLKIMLPAVLGDILNGLRLAIGIVWVVLVPCEMLGVNEGLGYFILDTRDRLAYAELMAAIVLIGIIGWALDSMARYAARFWQRS
ncbi:ABC transporter permease [Alysiella filiformis]|uniref:NitT/TauT family transport system permease protein n=1 Tax=Alysiella filiformis DSM 16848 TaxID=1120981 RepID=A0A286EA21_9NEIS|nr:ABC transporter permease [Alysiella filiformis]QMT31357.1 ABC transporter permease [Alysiella filiformis]UBQ55635.1 ABC transporter permease [Alysiella filiformis DSM 16848]SOD67729.1 NitT/TauT family transport system permease protein [Alysiella filiformis DSM 16848]